MNLKFKNALNKQTQKVPPIWFMRQAGRYHKHYQKLREKNSFKSLCTNPELAAQVALGPIEDFDFDVSILFSDLLFPLEAMGFGLDYTDGGPKLHKDISFASQLKGASVANMIGFMDFQAKALRLTREMLPKDKSLIGFVGGPWTLFVYASEGHHAGGLTKAKTDFFRYSGFYTLLKEFLKENIRLQLKAGAEVVMVLDTAAGELNPLFFQQEIESSLLELAVEFPHKLGYYSKTTYPKFLSNKFREGPWAGFGFDHRVSLHRQFELFQSGFLQGNFDQSLLFLDRSQFVRELHRFLDPIKSLDPKMRSGWICGLGHGVLPKTPEDNVKLFVDTVRETFSK